MSTFERTLATLVLLLAGLLAWRESSFPAPPDPPVVVRITGSVRVPGLVELPAGSRLAAAIVACGGFTSTARAEDLPLAEPLEDGKVYSIPARRVDPPAPPEQVAITVPAAPSVPEGSGSRRMSEPPEARVGSEPLPATEQQTDEFEHWVVDLNRATVDELVQVPGIGPVLAQRIVDGRDQQFSGTFRSLEDLATLRGIKGKTLERLKPHLKIEGI